MSDTARLSMSRTTIYTRGWVNSRMQGFWEELTGVRPVLLERVSGQPLPTLQNTTVVKDYAHAWVPWSELKAARLVEMQFKNLITYTGGDRWYFWNGVYHEHVGERLGNHLAEAFADEVVRAIDEVGAWFGREIAAAELQGQTLRVTDLKAEWAKGWAKHKKFQDSLHGDKGLEALKRMIRKQVEKPPEWFDDDRRWLVCQNCVIDLYDFKNNWNSDNFQVKELPHDPVRPVTRALSCDFDRNAVAPNWAHFLETSLPDQELRDFLQRLVGAAFMAESKVKAIPNLYGPKNCGKSVFVTTLDHLAQGYGVQPSPEALCVTTGQNWEQEKLRGKRFVGVSEPSISSKLDDTFCKQVTGGDAVHTRAHYQSSTEWLAQCVIFIASNHVVQLNSRDRVFLERLCFIEFPNEFHDERIATPGETHIMDKGLEEKLEAEHAGILQWIFYGMYFYLARGIDKPDSVVKAGENVAVESSSALTWVHEKVDEGLLIELSGEELAAASTSDFALVKNLYPLYKMDMEKDGDRALSKHAWGKHLKSHYGDYVKSGGDRINGLTGTGHWRLLKDRDIQIINLMSF